MSTVDPSNGFLSRSQSIAKGREMRQTDEFVVYLLVVVITVLFTSKTETNTRETTVFSSSQLDQSTKDWSQTVLKDILPF